MLIVLRSRFLCMNNDLNTECKAIKYVDDIIIDHISSGPIVVTLQNSVDCAINWSRNSNMKTNASKLKDIVVCYANDPPNLPSITVNGEPIDCVAECKIL